jgi:hypothetical protein
MNLTPLYEQYVLYGKAVHPVLNLFLCGLFLYAYYRHREQRAFLLYAIAGFCWTVVSTYFFCAHLKRHLGIEIFPFFVWRTLAFLYFILDPAATICGLVASIVLVRSYGRPSRRK